MKLIVLALTALLCSCDDPCKTKGSVPRVGEQFNPANYALSRLAEESETYLKTIVWTDTCQVGYYVTSDKSGKIVAVWRY